VYLPAGKSLGYFWNFGSLLAFILVFQILSGIYLIFFYSVDRILAFESVENLILRSSGFGWFIRLWHFNGARLFFIFIYLHIFKALFFSSYRLKFTWVRGLTIFLFLIAEAFMGYVLVWAQIRFWASVVITRLLSVIPFRGFEIVQWIWKGFTVTGGTIKFFFILHFLLPWLILILVLLHLIFLHNRGGTSKIIIHRSLEKIRFYNYYWFKDGLNIFGFLLFFLFVFYFPFKLGDPEIIIEANFIIRPVHIVPEWYFLFAYAILRAIPNKILGVLALLLRVLIFYFFVFLNTYRTIFDKLNKALVSRFFLVGLLLSWLGQCLVESPYVFLRGLITFFYFFFVLFLIFIYWFSTILIEFTFIIINILNLEFKDEM
jgi:ubiquinol-cytochrome c reductase cytochrome b subunit